MSRLRYRLTQVVHCNASAGYQRQALQVGGLAPVARRIEIGLNASNKALTTYVSSTFQWFGVELRAVRLTPTPCEGYR